jgi:hypothetical protein
MAGIDTFMLIMGVIGIIFLIMYLITFFAILNIRDNTEGTNVLLRKLVDSQDSLKGKKDFTDEDIKTKKFIEFLEKKGKQQEEKEFTAVEKD